MITRRLTVLAAAVLATACAYAPADPDPTADASETAAPVRSSQEIIGPWDIVSFEGYRPPLRLGGSTRVAVADFSGEDVSLRIGCNWSGVSGRVRNGRFVPDPDGERIQTLMGCGKEREDRDARLFGFFDLSPTVDRLADGRVRIAAAGRELILQRPAERRLDFLPLPRELHGDWRLDMLTRQFPQGGHIGMGLQDVPGRIVIARDGMGYSRCPQYDLTFRYTEDGRLQKVAGPDLPDSAVGCPELAQTTGLRDFPPTLWTVMEILHSDPLVERSGDQRVVLSAGEYVIEITKMPCRDGEPCAPP